MFLQFFLSKPNVHSATRTPIPNDLLNNWQKRVGKKRAKSTLYTSPSPIDDSESDSLDPIPPPLFKYTTRSSLAALAGGEANNVAGPSTIPQSQSNGSREIARNRDGVEVIEIEGISNNCCFEKKLN